MCVNCPLGCLDNAGVVGEAEVVVGAEVEDLLAFDLDLHALRGIDHSLHFVCTSLFDVLDNAGGNRAQLSIK
jgi:hypothetical protein